MAIQQRRQLSGTFKQLYQAGTLYENYIESELSSDAPLARYIYRIRQSLSEVEATFGNSHRQQKKKRKFSNRWRTGYNYHLEELLKCLCRY